LVDNGLGPDFTLLLLSASLGRWADAPSTMASLLKNVSDVLQAKTRGLTLIDWSFLLLKNLAVVNHYYIIYHDLRSLSASPPRKIGGGDLQLLRTEELEELSNQLGVLTWQEKPELLTRLVFFRNGFTNCYTLRVDGVIAYLHWIIYPGENEIIQKSYRRRFLPLRPNEVMIENAFTFPAYRGRGFLAFATAQLSKMAKDQGYKRVITYVRKDKIDALNGFMRLGFRIERIVREYKLLGNAWRAW
jgi:RimJ/RimL family protein N-acetyltransferase